jgi:hypothetical protein
MARLALIAMPAAASMAVAFSAPPASAQCRLCDKPTTQSATADPKQDVKLEIETQLNFDRLILFGASDGAAVIRPDGSRSVQGSITEIGPRAMVGTAMIHGEPGRLVRVDLPMRIELFSLGGDAIAFDQVTSDLPALPQLDASGSLSFRFGGRVRITGNADGDYRGDLPITVEYQ